MPFSILLVKKVFKSIVLMKSYINFTGGGENVNNKKIFSNISVVFCSNLMSEQLNIDSNSCDIYVLGDTTCTHTNKIYRNYSFQQLNTSLCTDRSSTLTPGNIKSILVQGLRKTKLILHSMGNYN